MSTRRTIAVYPAGAIARHARLFSALERAFPVEFSAGPGPSDAAIVTDGAAVPADVPTVVFAGGGNGQEIVTLRPTAKVDRRLWQIPLPAHGLGPALEVAADETLLAGAAGNAAWVRKAGAAPIDRLRLELPTVEDHEVLRDALQRERALGLIAIVDLLRRVSAGIAPEPPPVRAALLFDDPNLRWRSYGFIDYRRLVKHADEHHYHVAMAMIPLDAGRPHASAVSLFRRHPEQLSLAIHGNNHERLELMQPAHLDDALELGAQALRRIARFEAACGVRVARVMVPPHGMCSRTMAQGLAALPFDALCSAHPFPWTEHPPADALLAGWTPAAFPAGCAVIPRLPFGVDAIEIALRAYAGQPIVLYGHHEDVADGLQPLAEAAARVNRLGDVRWGSLEEIAQTNAAIRFSDDVALLAPYANTVRIPEGARTLSVSAPQDDPDTVGWRFAGGTRLHSFAEPVPVPAGAARIQLCTRFERDPGDISAPRRRVWPRVRRIATESRDRLLPVRP